MFSFSNTKSLVLAVAILFGSVPSIFCAGDFLNESETRTQLLEVIQNATQNDQKIISSDKLAEIEGLLTSNDYNDEVLLNCIDALRTFEGVSVIKDKFVKYLKNFVAVGSDISVDPNAAFIVDTINPDLEVKFKNKGTGEIKFRKYNLRIESVGLKIEFAVNLDWIKIIGKSKFNYYDTRKPMKIGKGVDVGVCYGFAVDAIYCRIEGTNCKLLILGTGIGIKLPIHLSCVYGGEMVPAAK